MKNERVVVVGAGPLKRALGFEPWRAALRTQGGNLTQVARELRIARSTLYLKVKKYGLDSYLSELRGRSTE